MGSDCLEQGLIVRDSSGRLLFVTSDTSYPEGSRALIERDIANSLGPYARIDGAVAFGDEPGVERLLKDPGVLRIREGEYSIRLLDRRVVGSAWTESPRDEESRPPCLVFASLKGGVGRSTALALTAADMARRNKNVLVLDLDLEAPGIGGLLLNDERTPRFGVVDYLVENGLRRISDHDLREFVGTSTLTSSDGGRVDIVPALGKSAFQHPGNTLPKLARAMIEDISAAGDSISVPAQIAELVSRFVSRDSYDVVLVDCRAGLSELAAPAILGLGATVLFFGTAQMQTIHGYSALFAGLKLLAQRASAEEKRADWRLRFKAVLAKAGPDSKVSAWYRDEMFEIFAENLYDIEDTEPTDQDLVTFNIDDTEAPHWPLVIRFDSAFVDFDPVRSPTQLELPFYEGAYRSFLNSIDSLIRLQEDTSSQPESEP